MASLTIKGIPTDLMERLRELADRERRSLNQQAIVILEQALVDRPLFSELYEGFLKQHGSPLLEDHDLEGVRTGDTGRSVEI